MGRFVQYRCFICDKKIYDSEEHAKKAAKRYRKEVGPRLMAYKSPRCGQWHLGHNRTKKRIRQIRKMLNGK